MADRKKKSDRKNCGGSDNNKNVTNLDNQFNCVTKLLLLLHYKQ